MMTRQQVKAARAILEWGVRDLAAKAGLAVNTVSRFENGAATMVPTLVKMRKALEAEGIDFPDDFTVCYRRWPGAASGTEGS